MMNRDNFIVYRSFYEAIRSLNKNQQLEMFIALFEFGLNGNEVELTSPMLKAMFSLIKPQLQANNKRYENGKKGGAPMGNSNAKKQPKTDTESNNETTSNNQQQPSVEIENNQKQPKNNQKQPNVNDNVNVNDNDIKKSEISLSKKNFDTASEAINFDKLVDYFNYVTQGVFGLVRPPISKQRKGMIKARIAEHGKSAFAEAIQKAVASDFLKGQNKSGFTATFDWLIKPTNFEKVISGNYDNKQQTIADHTY